MTQTESAILAHARRCAPAESCGFVISTPEGSGISPLCEYFRGAGGVFSYRTGRLAAGRDAGEIVALVHSHPGGLPAERG
ncbi:Mov34/MPN/PAD-1 family protein [Escherichia coli]|uniref:Mov34/MPN/PAD-1 family protein n=1 Tax=Escherichia coli TaxID=562 RepID=UPI00388D0AD2